MENESKPMNAAECLSTLNAGGWMVTGGREIGSSGIKFRISVKEASLDEGKIRVVTEKGVYEAPVENIISSDNGQRIMVLGVYTKKEQKKQIDGGGWCDVEYTTPALKFQTHASLIAADYAREERQKRAEEELKKWHEEQRRRNEEQNRLQEEARKTRQEKFARELSDKFVGKKITEIDVVGEDLHIEFEDGSKLSVVLDGSDTYGAWIEVNNISLRTFRKEEW